MKRLKRNAHFRFGFRKATSDATRAAALASFIAMVAATAAVGVAHAAPTFNVTLDADVSETQMVQTTSTGGTFRLRYGDDETADIPFNASPATVQDALNSLPPISLGGGSVRVVGLGGANGGQYRVTFSGGPLAATDVPQLVAVDGSSPLVSTNPAKLLVDTIEPAGLRRGDERLDPSISVSNTAPPVAARPVVGDTLGCDGARPAITWTPAAPAARPSGFTFEWWRNGAKIAGATDPSYVVTAPDAGAQIQCLVYAANSNRTATSVLASLSLAPTAPIVDPQPSPAPPAPTVADGDFAAGARPTVSGTGAVSGVSTRTCASPAGWEIPGGGAIDYEFQWLRNGQPITDTADATTATHTIVAADQGTVLQCRTIGRSGTGQTPGGGSLIGISTPAAIGAVTDMPTASATVLPQSNPKVVVNAASPVVEFELPAGTASVLSAANVSIPSPVNNYWTCTTQPASGTDRAKATCSSPSLLLPGSTAQRLVLALRLDPNLPTGGNSLGAHIEATGAQPVDAVTEFEIGDALPFGFSTRSLMTELLDPSGTESTQAGAHPAAAVGRALLNTRRFVAAPSGPFQLSHRHGPVKSVRSVLTEIPPGLVGNPLAVTELCDDPNKLPYHLCPLDSIVGEVLYRGRGLGSAQAGSAWQRKVLAMIEPEPGVPAQFAFSDAVTRAVYIINARLRPDANYAISLDAAPLIKTERFTGFGAVICSHGANTVSDPAVRFEGCKSPGDVGASEKPLLTNPTACTEEPLRTRMLIDAWPDPGVFSTISVDEPAMTGCEDVPFTPTVAMSPSSQTADSPSGLDASIDIPDEGMLDPEGIAQSHLKKTVVRLPKGVSVNPSAATGLEGCSDAQLGLGTDSKPSCPDGSKIGTVTATTPVLEETLSGVMVLRTPKSTDPMSGAMLRMALIVRNDERGILVKLPGSATADPQTGRLVATFDDSPQLPIKHVGVHLRGGGRGVLAIGQDCTDDAFTRATLTPWSGNADVVSGTPRDIDQRCDSGFAPKLAAGNSDNRARGQGGTYSFRFSREDGEQWVRGLTAKLPKGLLASVRNVPLCSNAAADAGNCSASSKIGIVDAKAGSGDPFVLEEKGEVFLTEGYKGGEYGLAVKIRPVAGPFRGQYELSPIVVRQAIHVDRATAEVTAVSDPFPLIHHGVPLRAREVHVLINRDAFMLNPSDCSAKQSSAELLSDEGTSASFGDPFQVSGCASLPFKPRLVLSLTGRRQVTTGKHPGIKAVVTQQGTSEAGIEQAVVRLPKSLALDPENAQALCEFVDGTKPDLENRCPAGSIVGRARAKTPLLKDDLVGNVYFVKNVRKDPVTGNEIRTLPMIVVALRGEIAINLKGESSTTRSGKLVNTFASVPDAPISQFNLNINGGKTGIVTVTRTRKAEINLCAGRHVAEADMDGHNGRRRDSDVRMKTPCSKRQVKRAKRAAAKAGRS